MAKTIAFRGKEKADFPYYIAKSLASNKFTVAVIDNSYSKDLFESVHMYADDDENTIEKENMVYLKDAVVDESFIEKFDFVIFYLGENERAFSTQYSFVISDYSNADINRNKKMGEDLLNDSYFVLRNKVTNKVTEKGIAATLDINPEQILGFIPINEKDEVAYLNLNYSGRQRIKDTSVDMQYAIMAVLSIVTGDDIAAIKKYYRKAKRNKRF